MFYKCSMLTLHIANKNYSSWSLRPWVLMHQRGITFTEAFHVFAPTGNHETFRGFAPNGKVPCLIDGDTVIWDSLAITEYLAEQHPGVWPSDRNARAWARCAAAEMHAGFAGLRSQCSMNIGVRVELHAIHATTQADSTRIDELWSQGLQRFGGPFLAGADFTAVDAFFAPVAFRIATYGLRMSDIALAYAARLRALPSMQQWYSAGIAETFRDHGHEAEMVAQGRITHDFRRSEG